MPQLPDFKDLLKGFRKKARAAPGEQENDLMEAFMESLPGIFYLFDAEGRKLRWNPQLEQVTGWSGEEIAAMRTLEFICEEDRPLVESRIEDVFQDGMAGAEARLLTRSGRKIPFQLTARLVRVEDKPCIFGIGIDVSGRERAEAALRDSEERYRALFEINPFPMLLVEIATGRVLEANKAAELHYGWTRKEFARLPLAEIWFSDFPDSLLEGDPDEVCSALNGCWLHRKKSGEPFEAQVSCRVAHLGSSPAAIVLVEDVTLRSKAAEFDAAISNLGHKLSAAATPKAAGRIIADISRDLIGWDAFSIFLFSPETGEISPVLACDTVDGVPCEVEVDFFRGSPPSAFSQKVLEEGSQLVLRDDGNEVETGKPFGDTSRRSKSMLYVPVKKGERTVGILSAQSYRPRAYSNRELKTLEALASHCAGALERLRVECALRTAEKRFAQAFESSPVAMCVASYEEGRALLINSAYVRLFGFSREEAIGKEGTDIGLWDDPKDRGEIYEAIHSGRRVRDMQVRLRTKGGELRSVLLSVEVIEVEGERCLLFHNHDITERLNLEAQLRQSQKLESIGQVAAGVAHDFNNMLTVIDGCTSLALAGDRLEGETRKLVEQVSSAANRAANVTRQLLAFSSRQKMALQEFNINKLLNDLTKMLRQVLGDSIRLEVRCAGNLPSISGDAGMIEQVVVNMAVNARDAMAQGGGRLLIETFVAGPEVVAQANLNGAASDRYICLRVGDSGCGISPGNLPRLFEPFFTTKEVGKGSGLGLATAYGIVKQHGGWIDVRSRIGEGTVFSVYLPACDTVSPISAEASPVASVPRGKERVLVVEDEPAVRELMCHILQFYGYRTLQADSGPAALEIWKTRADEIDAVLTDMVMPGGMDGRELGRRLLEERPGLPVLYTSGYSPDIAGCDLQLQDGVNFLQKPFEAAMLAQTLRVCIDAAAGDRLEP